MLMGHPSQMNNYLDTKCTPNSLHRAGRGRNDKCGGSGLSTSPSAKSDVYY